MSDSMEKSPGAPAQAGPDLHRPEIHASLDRYWRSNVRITSILLCLWALAGLVCGVLIADRLNAVRLPGTGYPLGFWFAQQGSIILFVLLIFLYCVLMNRLDARHHRELQQLEGYREGDGI